MTLGKDFLSGLGSISVNFQALERTVEFFIWCLISDDQTIGQIVTSENAFQRNCSVLMNLFRHRTQDIALIETLTGILKKAVDSEQKRNMIVHSVWLTDESDIHGQVATRFKITAKRDKGLIHHVEDMGVDDLADIDNAISGVARELIVFLNKCREKGLLVFPHQGP